MLLSDIIIDDIKTNSGNHIAELSSQKNIMLIFLRQLGCVFCREALYELSEKRATIEANGVQIVLVHMGSEAEATKYFRKFKLTGIEHISDPNCEYYARFSLVKATYSQLFGLSTWINTARAGLQNGIATTIGDGFQMPGVFMVAQGKVVEAFIHQEIYDRPDYEKFSACCNV